MKQIPLTQGKYAIVDDEDFYVLQRFTWHSDTTWLQFPRACFKSEETGTTYSIPITRFLFSNEYGGNQPIPLDGNYLNCSKKNITFVANQIRRQRQQKTLSETSSKYKGVCKANHQPKCWRGYIKKDGKQYTGYFYSEEEAAKWYNEKALELFGNLAYQNKIVDN